MPLVAPGDNVADLIVAGLERAGLRLRADDIVVVAQKIISKAENRFVDLATIDPSDGARTIAAAVDKDPRLVEVILGESTRIVRQARNLLITEHHLGFVWPMPASTTQMSVPRTKASVSCSCRATLINQPRHCAGVCRDTTVAGLA